jgi:hypothetical protein
MVGDRTVRHPLVMQSWLRKRRTICRAKPSRIQPPGRASCAAGGAPAGEFGRPSAGVTRRCGRFARAIRTSTRPRSSASRRHLPPTPPHRVPLTSSSRLLHAAEQPNLNSPPPNNVLRAADFVCAAASHPWSFRSAPSRITL